MTQELNLKERMQLLEGTRQFAEYNTAKYPQVGEDGRLHYYISGSIAVMLLAQADEAVVLDSESLPDVKEKETLELSDKVKEELQGFARQVGDLDYVETPAYKEAKKNAIPDFKSDPEGYTEARKRFMFKGGGGVSFDELPESAKNIFARKSHKIMCDPVPTHGIDDVLKIKVGQNEFYVANPRQIFGYKVLHMMQAFNSKPNKFKKDFAQLQTAFGVMYPEQELIKAAYSAVAGFEDHMQDYGAQASKYLGKLEDNSEFDGPVKEFMQKLVKYDSGKKKIMQR